MVLASQRCHLSYSLCFSLESPSLHCPPFLEGHRTESMMNGKCRSSCRLLVLFVRKTHKRADAYSGCLLTFWKKTSKMYTRVIESTPIVSRMKPVWVEKHLISKWVAVGIFSILGQNPLVVLCNDGPSAWPSRHTPRCTPTREPFTPLDMAFPI